MRGSLVYEPAEEEAEKDSRIRKRNVRFAGIGPPLTDSEEYLNDDEEEDFENTTAPTPRKKSAQKQQTTTPPSPSTAKKPRPNPSSSSNVPPEATLPREDPTEEQILLDRLHTELNHLVSRALQPVIRFVGMVAMRLRYDDSRILLQWNDNPKATMDERLGIVKKGTSLQDFVQKNLFLGTTFLQMFVSAFDFPEEKQPVKRTLAFENAPIGACFDLDGGGLVRLNASNVNLQNALRQLVRSEVEVQFAPAWAFESMDSAVFRAVLSTTCFGAIEAAAARIRTIPNCKSFTTKELMCSDQVSHQFSFLVSSMYLMSGDEVGSRGHGRNAAYLNIVRMRNALADSAYTCLIWFESVYARPHPLLQKFDEKHRDKLNPNAPFSISQDDLLRKMRRAFEADPSQQRAVDLYNALGEDNANTWIEAWNNYLDRNKTLTATSGVYEAQWNILFNRDSSLKTPHEHYFAQETSDRMLLYRQQMPQRELMYRG